MKILCVSDQIDPLIYNQNARKNFPDIDLILCAGLENGEVVVGKENISERVRETRTAIKQIFLKDGSLKVVPEVIDVIDLTKYSGLDFS